MTKIFLITGFLGSGKSTYLNRMLSDTDKKVGVLINEFGKIGVDTITLNRKGLDLIELTNGSIFCACLKDKFIDGLIELLKMQLDEIYIESSGLSDPSNMVSVVEVMKNKLNEADFKLAGTICIVDAQYFLKQVDVLENVKRQIKHSHFVIINKVDLVDEEHIQKVEQIIAKINPKAKVETASFGDIKLSFEESNIFDVLPEKSRDTMESRAQSMLLELVKPVSEDMLFEFFDKCKDFVLRAKGYVQIDKAIVKIDIVNDNIQIKQTDKDADINSESLNKIVLLLPRGLTGIKAVSSAIREVFGDNATLAV